MSFRVQLPPLPSQLTAGDERQVLGFFGSADRSIPAVGTCTPHTAHSAAQSVAQLLFFPVYEERGQTIGTKPAIAPITTPAMAPPDSDPESDDDNDGVEVAEASPHSV